MSADYKQGFLDGIRAYAWHKDGHQEVGTTGKTLKDALANVEKTWNYAPPPSPEYVSHDSAVMKMNEAIQRGLKHVFFHDGLQADTHGMEPAEAYREGWRDAWLEMADDLSRISGERS